VIFQEKRMTPIAVFLLLTAMGITCVLSLRVKSPTVDEFAHLPAGYYYWETGDFSLYDKSPPLLRLVCALPLLLEDVTVDWSVSHERGGEWRPWVFGTHFMRHNAQAYDRLFFWGRLPVVTLAVVLGLFVFRWAKALYGPIGGIISLVFYTFCPNMLAHARLATTDVGFTCFMFMTVYYAWKSFCIREKWSWIGAGGCFGLALLSKFTALLLFPVLAVLAMVSALPTTAAGSEEGLGVRQDSRKRPVPDLLSLKNRVARLGLMVITALLVVNLGYGFRGGFEPLSRITHKSRLLGTFDRPPINRIPLPVPAPYVQGFDSQKVDAEQGVFLNYLRGRLSTTGWWYYFIYAFFVKVPLATIVTLLLSIWIALRTKNGGNHLAFLVVPILTILAAFSLWNRLNVGIRYILPAFPFLFVWFGSLACPARPVPFVRKAAIGALLVSYGFASVSVFPNYLSFFNTLAGGPENGHKHLLDSNLDWGQDLKQLKGYLKTNGISEVGLAYFGHVDPSIYGIAYHTVDERPQAGHIAVSANYLFGLPYVMTYTSPPKTIQPGAFQWLHDYSPVACIGHSIYVYSIPITPPESPPLPH